MSVPTIGTDLAKNVLVIDDVDEAGKVMLVKSRGTRSEDHVDHSCQRALLRWRSAPATITDLAVS